MLEDHSKCLPKSRQGPTVCCTSLAYARSARGRGIRGVFEVIKVFVSRKVSEGYRPLSGFVRALRMWFSDLLKRLTPEVPLIQLHRGISLVRHFWHDKCP